jgi:hypothetical protein
MKIWIAINCFIIIGIMNSYGQNFINYKTHAIQAGYIHVTQKIENVNEGMSGSECFWDFSSLICGEISSSTISDASESIYSNLFENSNLAINGGDVQFFFHIDENQLEYFGYISQNTVIQFDNPIIRMKYPFNYQDKFEGTFKGTGLHNDVVQTSITGNYSIEADGKGSLLLPNGLCISNAFRVKSVEYFNETACNTAEWTITKYLWYTPDYRYPVFTLIHTEIKEGEKQTVSHNAYYNEEAIQLNSLQNNEIAFKMRLSVYPNPTEDRINIKYFVPEQQDVSVELFSISGVKIEEIVKDQKQKGEYKYEFSAAGSGIVPGVYLINFLFGSKAITKQIIVEY